MKTIDIARTVLSGYANEGAIPTAFYEVLGREEGPAQMRCIVFDKVDKNKHVYVAGDEGHGDMVLLGSITRKGRDGSSEGKVTGIVYVEVGKFRGTYSADESTGKVRLVFNEEENDDLFQGDGGAKG